MSAPNIVEHAEWETVHAEVAEHFYPCTERMHVPGGWLYRVSEYDFDSNRWISSVMTFVPDASANTQEEREWTLQCSCEFSTVLQSWHRRYHGMVSRLLREAGHESERSCSPDELKKIESSATSEIVEAIRSAVSPEVTR